MVIGTRSSHKNVGRYVVGAGLLLAACGSTNEPSTPEAGVEDSAETTSDTEIGAESGGTIATSTDDPTDDPGDDPQSGGSLDLVRGDVTIEGNRVLDGRGRLDAAVPVDVELPGTPERIMPIVGEPGFVVVLEDGTTLLIDIDRDRDRDRDRDSERDRDRDRDRDSEREPVVVPAPAAASADPQPRFDVAVEFDDPLPDGRIVSNGNVAAALVEPTDRYPHGVLGDRIEAAAVQVIDLATGERVAFGPEPPTVIEGIQPMLVDVDGDGTDEVLVTESNAEVGAGLAVWTLDGDLLARSIAIGQGNRWRNQLAVAPVGPDGEIEIIDVRTPHLGGTLQYFRIDGDGMELVASVAGYTSHRIGSRNLDLGVVADADGDGRLDVVLPNDRRTELGIVTRVETQTQTQTEGEGEGEGEGHGGDGAETVATVALPGRLTTNVIAADVDGDLWFAAGTDEDVLRIWPGGSAG